MWCVSGGSRYLLARRLAVYLERAPGRHHIVLTVMMEPKLTDGYNIFTRDIKAAKLTSYSPTCQGILSPEKTRVPCSWSDPNS
jgi:hypothetical protein